MSFRLGPLEAIIILVVVLIIFGVGRLPQISEAIGKGLSSLRRSKDSEKDGDAAPDKPKLITKLDDGDTPGETGRE